MMEYYSCRKTDKNILRVYMLLGDALSTQMSVWILNHVMDFEPCFKDHNLVFVYPKMIKLGQLLVSVQRLVKIWKSSQFPA